MSHKCKEKKAAYMKQWRADNKESIAAKKKKWQADNKEAQAAYNKIYMKQWRADNKESIAAKKKLYNLKNSYGLTEEDYQSILEAQNGCCPICLKHHTEFTRRLAVDHIHDRAASGLDYNKGVSGAVRGLLCDSCNTGIGKLGDSLDNFIRLIAYKMGSDLCPFTLTERDKNESD